MGNKKDEIAYLEEVFGISKPKQTSDDKSDTATSDKSESTKVTLEPTTTTSDQSGSTKISPEPAISTSDQSVSTEIATSPSSTITSPTSNQVPEAASPNTTPSTVPESTSAAASPNTTPSTVPVSTSAAASPNITPSTVPESIPAAPLTTPGSAHYSAPYGTSNKSHVDMLLTMKDSWMLRHCDSYLDELKSCRSLHGRFHQFYVHGRAMDCSDWEASFDDCKAWNSKADEPAARRIIDREKLRIGRRLKAHYDNDVWEKRQAPPPEWEKPLPKWLTDKNEDSYFAAYIAEKTKEANATVSEANLKLYSAKATNMMPSCSIM